MIWDRQSNCMILMTAIGQICFHPMDAGVICKILEGGGLFCRN